MVSREWPHTFGTVRPSLEQNYYDVLNQENVDIVPVKEQPIESFTEKGIKMKNGEEKQFDAIILATGFDTHTGGFQQIDIRGQNGVPLTKKWGDGCNSFLGLATAGFPNMFFLYGPHGPTAYSNGPSTVEIQAEWTCDFLDYMRNKQLKSFDVDSKTEEEFTKHNDDLSAATLFHDSHGW